MNSTIVYGIQCAASNSGKYNGFVHEGGSRSSKTTSIIQFWLTWAERQDTTKRVVIAREKNTWTRTTVLYDFVKVMKAYDVYNKLSHNKTEGIIKYHNVEFWFAGLDDPQKIHGFTSDAFWLNEANEVTKDDFDQLEMRCSGFFVLDYNPNMNDEHWIITSILKRSDVKYIHSTVLDNPFAPEAVRRKIMSYEPTVENYNAGTADKNKWEIYGLGVRAKIEGLIFDNWTIRPDVSNLPNETIHGIDFGYTNDPTAIVEVRIDKRINTIVLHEVCYQTGMLNPDIARRLIQEGAKKAIADSAEPKSIQEIYNHGVNIHPVKKGAGSVMNGIDIMKRFKIEVTPSSVNLIKELRNYKYRQDKNGKYINEPIDDFNHCLDAARYVCMTELDHKKESKNKDLTNIFF